MAGTQQVMKSTTVVSMTTGSTAAATAGGRGHVRPLAQVLSELLDALATLLAAKVTSATQAQHKVDVAKLHDEIARAKEDLNAENARMATERALMDAESQRIRAEAFRLSLDQNVSNVVFSGRHQSCLPLQFEGWNLFNTPGVGTSYPPW